MGIELGKESCDNTYIIVAFLSLLYIAEDDCKESLGICKTRPQLGIRLSWLSILSAPERISGYPSNLHHIKLLPFGNFWS